MVSTVWPAGRSRIHSSNWSNFDQYRRGRGRACSATAPGPLHPNLNDGQMVKLIHLIGQDLTSNLVGQNLTTNWLVNF